MILQKTSWHFRLHQLLYGRHAREPRNFCPYFWGTIILGLVVIVPFTIMAIPLFILEVCMRNANQQAPRVKDDGYFSAFIFIALVADIALMSLYGMIAMWFMSWGKDVNATQIFGILGYVTLVVTIFLLIRSRYLDWREVKREKRRASLRAQGLYPYTSVGS